MKAAEAATVFREMARAAKSDRAPRRCAVAALAAGDVLTVTRLDRLARYARDLSNALAATTAQDADFRSVADTWATPPRRTAGLW